MQRFATCDDVAAALRALRASAGQPSFAQIATRIADQRVAEGMAPEVARPGRTTVYDAFRDGRRRIDAVLVGEIVRALGVDEVEAERWEAECRLVGRASTPGPPQVRAISTRLVQIPTFPSRRRNVVLLLVACVLANLGGRLLVNTLGIALHLDMVGTAVGAVALGPWWGALIGLVTNISGSAISGPASIPFALVNIAGALLWGYGVRRGRWGDTLSGYFALNVGVAVACSVVAAPILLLLFGGEVGHASDSTTDRILAATHSMVLSVASSNLLTSLADKLISGFVALVAIEAWATRRRH